MTGIIVKSKIREVIKELDKEGVVTSVSESVETELEKKVLDILAKGIERAKANQRRTLLDRDL